MTFVFAGTPEFGARVLGRLVERGLIPRLVVTQPARPAGRGLKEKRSAVAAAAEEAGLPLLEAGDINLPEVVASLRASGAEALVVAAFGQLLRAQLLDSFLCVNVHASLLPRYRGAAPIARALMAGDDETGACVMRMTAGLDEGPVAARTSVAIAPWQDAGDVGAVLALLGADALAHVLDAEGRGGAAWREQEGEATYAAKVTAEDRTLVLDGSARRAHNGVRALSPAVGVRAVFGSVPVTVWRTWPHEDDGAPAAGDPGAVVSGGGRLFVGCARGSIEVLELQPAGKKRMDAASFLRGYAGKAVTGGVGG